MKSAVFNKVFIALGTNLGNRMQNLENAAGMIENDIGKIIKRSSVYETAPWGYSDQPDFYNQIIIVNTALTPTRAMKELLKIENRMGRERSFKNASRVIDLDILFFSDKVVKNKTVTIPHPFIEMRKFVLIPLNEIASGWIHPVTGKPVSELLESCEDQLEVKKLAV